MPTPIQGREAVDVGGGVAATYYSDGTVSFWSISTGQGVADAREGDQAVDLGNGTAATLGAGGATSVWNINSGQGVGGVPPYTAPNTAGPSIGGQQPAGGTLPNGTPATGQNWWMQGAIPANLAWAQKQPGYLPGSMTYNQMRLDDPNLLTAGGQPAQYGSGGAGDPNTGAEAQTPMSWRDGGQLFVGDGTNLEGEYSVLGNNLARVDAGSAGGAGSGAGSAAFPEWAKPTLLKAIGEGRLTPTARGQQYMTEVLGIAPTQYGGKVAQPTQGPGAGAPGGAAGAAGQGGFAAGSAVNPDLMNAITNAAQMAYQRTYSAWLQSNGDEQTAIAKATQAANQASQEAQARVAQQNVGIQAATLMGSLRGPSNAFANARVTYGLNQQGIPNAVAALSGQYSPTSFQAPQQAPQAQTLQTLASQLGAAGTGGVNDVGAMGTQWMNQMPQPNQIVGRNFARLDSDTQKLALAGYEAAGFSPEGVLDQIKGGLPAFAAPAYGSVG